MLKIDISEDIKCWLDIYLFIFLVSLSTCRHHILNVHHELHVVNKFVCSILSLEAKKYKSVVTKKTCGDKIKIFMVPKSLTTSQSICTNKNVKISMKYQVNKTYQNGIIIQTTTANLFSSKIGPNQIIKIFRLQK